MFDDTVYLDLMIWSGLMIFIGLMIQPNYV